MNNKIILFIMMLCLFSYSVTAESSLLNNLTLYISFENATTTAVWDDNGKLPAATAYNTPSIVTGKNGNGMLFDSSNSEYVTFPVNSLLDFKKNVTMMAWIKYNAKLKGVIIDKGYNGGTSNNPYRMSDMDAATETFGSYDSGYGWVTVTNKSFPINTWYHIAMRFNGTFISVFLNGTQIGATSFTNDLTVGGYGMSIGMYNSAGTPSDFLNGTVDELAMWNRSLSNAEIQQLSAGLYYPFITDSLTVNIDSSYIVNTNTSFTYIFNFTAVPNSTIANCSFWFNGTNIENKTNLLRDINYNFTVIKTPPLLYNISSNITCIGNNSINATSTMKYVLWNLSQPTVLLLNKTPSDFSNINIIGVRTNFTYGFYNFNILNTTPYPYLYLKINDSTTNCLKILNGSCYDIEYIKHTANNNVSSLTETRYSWLFSDNELLPGTYNYNETIMENTPHIITTLNNNQDEFKIQIINVTATSQYNFFEIDLNATPNTSVTLSYCNSSYSSGQVTLSPFCTLLGTIANTAVYNHTHTAYSMHHVLPFGINSTGYFNGIYVSSTSYFIVNGKNSVNINIEGITNVARIGSMHTSSNGGTSWTDISTLFTADAHLHQFKNTTTLYYYASGQNTEDKVYYNSSIGFDLMELGGIPPNPPLITKPVTGYYRQLMNISYTLGISPSGFNVSLGTIEATRLEGTDYCYQESTNISNDCGGKSTGKTYVVDESLGVLSAININNAIDGNYDTYGQGSITLYVNYSKVNNSLNTSLWRIKNGYLGDINYSIPNACWNGYKDKIVLRVITYSLGNPYNAQYHCFDNSSWIQIAYSQGGQAALNTIYEEGIIWNISKTYIILNTSNYYNTSYIWNTTEALDGIYELKVTEYDIYNISSYAISQNFTIDNTIPQINITNPNNDNVWFNTLNIISYAQLYDIYILPTFYYYHSVEGIWRDLAVSSNVSLIGVLTPYTDGVWYIIVNASDLAGNNNSLRRYVKIDTTKPTVNITSPNINNQTWITNGSTLSISGSCSNTVNISLINISCYTQAGLLAFNNKSILNNASYTVITSTNNFTGIGDYRCNINCSSISNIQYNEKTVIVPVVQTMTATGNTNLSSYIRVNGDFDISVLYNFNGDIARCTLIPNDSIAVSCNSVATASPSKISCTMLTEREANVTFYSQCNSTTRTYINNINSTISSGIFVDNIEPIINVSFPLYTNTTLYANNTLLKFNITVRDSNMFGFEINCSLSGIQKFLYTETNINKPFYEFYNETTFNNPGTYYCSVNTSDDHTATIFKSTSKIEKGLNKYTGNVGDIGLSITSTEVMKEATIIEKYDRKAIRVELDSNKQTKTVSIDYYCPYDSFKRTTKYKEHWVCANGINGYWLDGETTDSKDLVSSKYDKKTKIITLTYTTNNDYIESNSIGGLNYGAASFSFTIIEYSNMTFTAYNAWNGSTINRFNVSLTHSNGTKTEYSTLSGKIVSNLPSGTYTAHQTALDYGFGNLSQTTYISGNQFFNTSFWQSQITINAIEYPAEVPAILLSVQTNNTNIVNNSITSTGTITYRINNGTYNIYANNSEYSPTFISTSGSLATGETTSISLNFSRLFNLVIYREETGELFNLSDTNETNVSIIVEVICSTKKQVYNILTNPSLIPNLSCNWRQEDNPLNLGWKISVDYPSIATGDAHFRFINPSTTDTNVEAYLMNINDGDELVETILSVNDLANRYDQGILTAERTINNTIIEVLSQKVDISSSVQFWMDQNANYYIYIIDDSGLKTELKYLVAEQESTKTVVVPAVDLEAGMDFQQNDYRIQLSANKYNGSATVKVTDFKNVGYDTLQWQIFLLTPTVNVSNQSLAVQNGFYNELSVFNVTLVDGYNVTYIINSSLYPLFANQSYSSRVIVTLTNGDIIATNGTVLWYSTPYSGFDGFDSFAADIKLWFAMIAMLMVILGFSALSMELGFGMALVTGWIFYFSGWLLPLQTRIPVFGQNNIFWLLSLFTLLEGIMVWRMLQRKT